jgi:hypothetical protein
MARSAAEEIAIYLATLTPSLGTIKVHDLPASPDAIGAVRTFGGSAPSEGFGHAGVEYEHPTVQVCFRGAPDDSEAPRLKAQQAFEAITKIQAQTLSGTMYNDATPLQSPFPYKDPNNRFVWTFNVYIEKEPSA